MFGLNFTIYHIKFKNGIICNYAYYKLIYYYLNRIEYMDKPEMHLSLLLLLLLLLKLDN